MRTKWMLPSYGPGKKPKTQWLVWRRSLMKLGPVLTWEGQSFTWRTHSLNGETHGSWKDTNLGMLNGIPTLRIFPFGGVPLEWHSGLSWPSLTLTGEDSFILLVVREKKKIWVSQPFYLSGIYLLAGTSHSVPTLLMAGFMAWESRLRY